MIPNDRLVSADAVGVGTSRRRPEAWDKVTGAFDFSPDLYEEDMLWGATLRSPHAFAKIRRIDLNPAKQMPGVHAVLGAWDVPDNHYGVIERDTPVLADDYVRYQGEPVAIVAAVDRETARRACEAIIVDYEVLEPVTDPIDALDKDRVYRHTNVTHGDTSVIGEVQAEGEYSTPRQDHSFLAPDGGIAKPDGHGGVIIIGAAQWVHSDRHQVADALDLPEEMVLVKNSGVGGAFGGRFVLSWQVHGALLALHTNRPVKFVYTRQETFLARYHRQPSRIWVRHHAKRDGTIVKLEAKILYETGPYLNTGAVAIGNGSSLIQGPYRVDNAHVEGWSVATNNGMTGSLRGFGVVEPIFAVESNMDHLARTLNMDGAELRAKNAISNGDTWIFNQVQDSPAPVKELVEQVMGLPLPDDAAADLHPVNTPGGLCSPTRPSDITRGVSMAAAAKNVCLSEGAPVNSTAVLTLRDGQVTIDCAAAEVGQGFKTVAIQMAQSSLGISDVNITWKDDTHMPLAATTDGQQQTMTSGAVVAKAAEKLKKRFLVFYAREHGLDASDLDIEQDMIVTQDGQVLDSVADGGMGLVFRATDYFAQRQTRPLEDRDSPNPMHVTMNFSANRCVVDVDTELGLVNVVQMDVVQDVGRVVNPAQAAGQIAGGSLMGMGLAMMENMAAEDGNMLTTDWSTYQVPSIIDAPTINVHFVEHAEPNIPFGVRGIAELPHVQSPPAILNALRAATKLPLPSAPATPEKVSGIAIGVKPNGSRSAGQPVTIGPWKAPKKRTDVGPWRATLPEQD